MRPLPSGLDEAAAIACIPPSKDVDGCTTANVASVYAGDGKGFAPCTPEGVMRLLDHYGVRLDGARVCVLGRSLVVGRPLASLLVSRDATVTICHSHTADLALECRSADVVVSAMGRARSVTSKMIAPGSVVIDVGMNVDDEGRLCGDVDYEAVSEVASAVTPVPRGTGSVTTSVLAEHVVRAAEAAAVEGV
jgi:methylenetetrahydrofolate dehydrogenase (NADP+)/methenyltetrahydrofolate cyclohydrolase